MKARVQIVKELVDKYPNNYQLGAVIRGYFTKEYWKKIVLEGEESQWEKELKKI